MIQINGAAPRKIFFRNKAAYCAYLRGKCIWGANVPTDGLVFYAPLDAPHDTAETGQTLSYTTNVVHEDINGIPVATFPGGGYRIDIGSLTGFPFGSAARSISAFLKVNGADNEGLTCGGYGATGDNNAFLLQSESRYPEIGDQWLYNHYILKSTTAFATLKHICFTYDGVTTMKCYVDGALDSYLDDIIALGTQENEAIGSIGGGACSVGSLRLYNRALEAAEVMTLAKEFK